MLATLAVAAWAGPITDPAMGLDDGSLSSPITGATFSPINGGGVFEFFNDTGRQITLLAFETTVLPGLTSDQLATFVCNDAVTRARSNPFFLNCSIAYQSVTGVLDVSFFGTNSGHPGIPPADPGCEDTSQTHLCAGHFFVILNDNFAFSPNAGGWADPTLVGPNPITFDVSSIVTDTPEPATAGLAGAGTMLLAILCHRRRRLRSS